jgi:fluoride exporter
MNWLAIAIGGTLGCWLRYGQTLFVQNILGREFPSATMSINVIGSFLMGFLFVATTTRIDMSVAMRLGILTGFLGGYTTFSTFSMETLLLVQNGFIVRAALYVALSVGLGFGGAVLGVFLARLV